MSQLSKPSIDFGLNFLKKLESKSDSKNTILSPLSVIIAFGMVLEGAIGETEKQIKEVLNLDKIDDQERDISKIIRQLLEKYKTNEDDNNCILEFGNLLMANKKCQLQKSYVQSLLTNYFAEASNEDFSQGEQIITKVNSWVSKNTRNKIPNILNKPPEKDDICFLVNTIYFDGKWVKPFWAALTYYRTFNNANGSKTMTKMMILTGDTFNFVESHEKKLKIVEIPYVGNMSMILILPTHDNNLKKVIDNLDSAELTSLLESMKQTRLDTLIIPKFKLEGDHILHEILPCMGMILPFNENAEFPKITEGSSSIYISESIQKAVIEVSEKGTIASAVTSSRFVPCCAVFHYIQFIADRPFMFFIRDNEFKVNLFMGQLNNMTDQQFL